MYFLLRTYFRPSVSSFIVLLRALSCCHFNGIRFVACHRLFYAGSHCDLSWTVWGCVRSNRVAVLVSVHVLSGKGHVNNLC